MLELLGVGQAHPENVIDNAFLESLAIETSNEWILERVGIAERRTVLPLDYIRQTRNTDPTKAASAAVMTLSELAAIAAKEALTSAHITAGDIGMVIGGISIPQMRVPANACLIANELGIQAAALDINSACTTFAAHLHFLHNMKSEALPDYILLVQAETYTLSINFNDRNSAVLFGDGASAQVVSSRKRGKATVLKTNFTSDPSSWNKVIVPASGHFTQDGSAVQKFAIQRTVQTAEKLLDGSELANPYFIGHQANLRMLESSAQRLGMAPDHHFYNVDKYGNCGGAGAPSVLAENWNRFKTGDHVAIATVGAGLSWGGALIQFRE